LGSQEKIEERVMGHEGVSIRKIFDDCLIEAVLYIATYFAKSEKIATKVFLSLFLQFFQFICFQIINNIDCEI